jgi:hypothetical protein
MTLRPDTGTRNGTGNAQESADNHRDRSENPQESKDDPEQSGPAPAVGRQSGEDPTEPAGDHKKPKEDPGKSGQDSHEVAGTFHRAQDLEERMSVSTAGIQHASGPFGSFYESLNTRRHRVALQAFMALVLFHWLEHLVQAYQFFVMRWSRSMSMGMLGMYYPWLMQSEVLHYGFALVMLLGLWMLRKAFTGTSRTWWMVAFWIQFWHHFEHFILFYQAQTRQFWFGGAVPTSVGQIWIPRIELHLIYNALVFIPMVFAMYYHVYPPSRDAVKATCACARRQAQLATAA